MALRPLGRSWNDRLFAGGLGLVMAITLAFFVMAIPARLFDAVFSSHSLATLRISQWSVASVMAGLSGFVVALLFLPPRAAPELAVDAPVEAVAAEADDELLALLAAVEEGVLDLIEEPAMTAEEERFFIDIAAIRAQAVARELQPTADAMIERIDRVIAPAAARIRRRVAAVG